MSDTTRRRRAATSGPKQPKEPNEAAFDRIRAICLALPDTAETTNHSRPSFTVRGKTFVMFMDNHHGDGRLAIWCKATPDAQRMIVDSDPERFFVPPYVGPRGWVGARLDRRPEWGAVAAIIEEAYALAAPKRAARKGAGAPAESPRGKPAAAKAPANKAPAKKASKRAAPVR